MIHKMTINSKYRIYCKSSSEEAYFDAVANNGSNVKAAEALGVNRRTVDRAMKNIVARANLQGFAPENDLTHPVPDTHIAKGVSTMYDANGDVKLQWVKSDVKADGLKDLAEGIARAMEKSIKPKKKIPAPRKIPVKDLLAVYPMGDPHIGLYSWHEETGNDFDCEIAERDLRQAVDYLVYAAPATEECLIANLGDFFHADDASNTTSRSGNTLDVDGRWSKVLDVGIAIMEYVIDKALEKHKKVTVINEIGNHDDHTSIVLSRCLHARYKLNPRVTIDNSPKPCHYYRFGKVMIGTAHGDKTKPDILGEIMAVDRAKDWGETLYRYWLTGHIHHISRKEFRGCVVESFRTMAGKDAWHSHAGYRSGRDMNCIVYHKDFGEVSRIRFDIRMVKK